MTFPSEIPPNPVEGVNSGRGANPATGLTPDNQPESDLIDDYLQYTWAYRDKFLYVLNLKLRALKSQRNLRAPIHKLPVELLVYIFQLSLPAPETALEYAQMLGTLLGVCTHWCTVIYAATSLWAVVTSREGPDFLALSLTKLASNCPLHIDCGALSDEDFIPILRQIAPHIHRWETASIVMPQTEEGRKYLSVPAPRLRRLHLRAPPGTFGSEINSQALDIFNGSAERLEEVKVTWTRLPWDSPILRGLKSLHLQDCRGLRVSNIITILNDCPDLVTLVINDVEIAADVQADPSKVVSMTKLENIDFLVGELEEIGEIMNGFNAPNCKSFEFNFGTVWPGDTEDFILTKLAPYFPFFRRMMLEGPKTVIDFSSPHAFHIQCPPETEEEQFVGFNLRFSVTPPDAAIAFLRQVLGEGESSKPDARLIIGRDWGTAGLSILAEIPLFCNVVDLWLGAYDVLRDFDTGGILWSLAQPEVLPTLHRLIISGDGWDGENINAILRRRYDQENRNVPSLRIRLIGRGVNANYNLVATLKEISMIEEAFWSERTQVIDSKDV